MNDLTGGLPPGSLPQPPRKRHTARNVILICAGALAVVIIAVVVIIAAAGSGSTRPLRAATPAASAAPAAQSVTDSQGNQCPALDQAGYCPGTDPSAVPAPTGPDQLAIGQTETLADNSNTTEGTVTVLSATVTTQPADLSFGEHPANGYFVIVHVSATADPSYTGGFDVNELDFYARAGGQHFDTTSGNGYFALSTSQNSSDLTATLAAGETSSGWIAFDVTRPHGQIVYAPNIDGQPVAEWRY